ncbi:glycosyltransferase [Roseovarius atlanticus]|nr:glycosyltransferase [Roseovarius atlanticus]MBY6127061.1 glycosyltransferase [Roseovarius atlanticus]
MDEQRRARHREAFEAFDDFLTLRQQDVRGEDGTDIREKVLARRKALWSIGYAGFNLDTAYAANMRLLWPNLEAFDAPDAQSAQNHLLMGTIYADPEHSHTGAVATLQHYQPGHRLLLGEQGFLATSHSWSEAFRRKDPHLGCLGYIYDDIAYYFMADYPNRLIHRLNGDHALTAAETARARTLIDRIVAQKVSKYNSQPIAPPAMTRGYMRRVLVCDQTFADASTIFGKIDEAGFERMLLAALAENPDAEILVKTHPDTAWEKETRTGYYNHLADTGRVRIMRAPINPYMLFDAIDKVYVGTSQIGLEALFAGKEVVCFGAPFYAGWGLTDDRQKIPHRHRARTLEEIFHYFYIWYTIYHVPGAGEIPSRIEDALDYIEAHRPARLPAPRHTLSTRPKVSVIIPVYGVEAYIGDCLASVQAQTLEDIEIITVNDRSPDQSQAVIDAVAACDPRIRPIVLERNIGQGFARNIGLEAARGDYVWFLDSDDYMPSRDHLRQVHDCALADAADMVRGRKLFEQIEDAEGNVLEMRRDPCEIHFSTPFHAETIASAPRILRSRHFCNWLYRRDFLKAGDIRFLTAQWEERPFLLRALLSATSISGTTSEAFIYRIRQASTARRPKTLRDSFNQLANFEQITAVLEEFGAFVKDSPQAYAAGYMVMQALHILYHGFAYRTVRISGNAADARRFLDRTAGVLARTGLIFEDMVFDAPQISKERLGTHSYRLLFEALRQRRFDYVDIAVDGRPIEQETVMNCLLRDPADADEAAFQTALSLYARNERVITATGLAPRVEKPRLVIHVGQTKTGSTYIQHFLEQNRPALLRAGIWVPDKGLVWQQTRPHKQAGHGGMTREAVNGDHEIRDHIEAALSLAEGRIHTVILSSEAYFLNRRSALIPDHFEGYKAEMIGYFRRQDEWANSQYAEFVAGGAMGRVSAPFAEWIDDPMTRERLDYFSYCQLWAARLGRDAVHARIYDRAALRNGDVVSDFLATLGLEAMDGLDRPDSRQANDMPFGTGHVLMLREINGYDWPDGGAYLDFIQDVSERIIAQRRGDGAKEGGAGRVDLIGSAERSRLLNDLEAENAAFARVFCTGAETAFAVPDPAEAASGRSSDAGVSVGEIVAIHAALHEHNAGTRAARAPMPARPVKPVPDTAEAMKTLAGILLDVQDLPSQVAPGAIFEAEVTVFNLSGFRVPSVFRGLPVNLSYHIFDTAMKRVVWDGLRVSLGAPLDYQYRGVLRAEAPQARGSYRLQAGLVAEGHRWFNSHQTWLFEVR